MPSWLAAVEAEIQAKANAPSASLRALDRAETALDRVEAGEVPAWMDYYDTTRLNGFKGFAYLRLRRPADAQAALRAALGSLGASATKQRTIFQADLATSFVQQGEIDEGCRLAGQAAATLAQAGYATSGGRLREFRELVTPWQDRPAVKEFALPASMS